MILIGNRVINETLIVTIIESRNSEGSIIQLLTGSTIWDIPVANMTPKQIYQVIEEKSGAMRSLKAENERLKKELKDTEDLYIKANTENESLRERLNEPKLPGSKWRTKDCPGYMETADGCAGLRIAPEDGNEDTRIHTMCTACELFAFFCVKADADDNGCTGRRQKNGEFFPRCIDCIGLIAEE